MDITRANEPLPALRAGLVGLLVGEYGLGKTSLGSSLNTLLLDFDEGATRAVNRRDVAVITDWSHLDQRPHIYAPYDAVTIDTVEGCLAVLKADIVRTHPTYLASNGELTPQGWGVLRTRFAAFLTRLRQTYRKDVLLLAHARTIREGERTRIVPRIPGGSLHEVLRLAHFVGLLELRGGRRVLDFGFSDRFHGKDSNAQWGPLLVPPADQARAFMEMLLARGRAVLTREVVVDESIADDVALWTETIAEFATPADWSRGYAALVTLKADQLALYTQVYHRFTLAAKARGMKYQRDGTFQFVGVPPSATAPARVVAPRVATWQPALLSELTR